MQNSRYLAKLLLWVHLFVCIVWLTLFQSQGDSPGWMAHVFIWSILGIQFTWGFTVGLIVGPGRKRRPLLWWSLLTVFMPLWLLSKIFVLLLFTTGLPIALVYLALFVMILACETFGGVLLGAKIHSDNADN